MLLFVNFKSVISRLLALVTQSNLLGLVTERDCFDIAIAQKSLYFSELKITYEILFCFC